MNEETRRDVVSSAKGDRAKAAPGRALSPFEEMDRMFDQFFRRGWMRPWHRGWSELLPFEGKWPRADVIDRDNEVVVRAEVPGIDKKDLDISITENAMTIKGTSRREEKEEKGDYYRCETTQGSFSRTLTLPCNVDGTRAKASFKDGVVEVTVPKLEQSRRLSVKVD